MTAGAEATGPLADVRVIELAAQGPVPLAGMLLADLGADVVRVDRTAPREGVRPAVLRGHRSIAVDLTSPAGTALARRLIDGADVLLEGFRPGVMERLGLGPEEFTTSNPALVYGRMTGWGQDGPLSRTAGHDINYLALSGLLRAIGRPPDRPVAPLNLVGDYGGGSMFLVMGVLAALLERTRSGRGQVVDAAMADGIAVLSTPLLAQRALGAWSDVRGSNFLDTGGANYEVYECADGEFVAVGALEPSFYRQLVAGLIRGCPEWAGAAAEADATAPGPGSAGRFADAFRRRTRAQWAAVFEGTDACVVAVLSLGEAPDHPHHRARGTYTAVDGIVQAAPAPRFSSTPGRIRHCGTRPGDHTRELLAELGVTDDEIAVLVQEHTVHAPTVSAHRSGD